MFVIDIEKCEITVERETVKPFDVAATRDGALGVGEVLLVTCHKGKKIDTHWDIINYNNPAGFISIIIIINTIHF